MESARLCDVKLVLIHNGCFFEERIRAQVLMVGMLRDPRTSTIRPTLFNKTLQAEPSTSLSSVYSVIM